MLKTPSSTLIFPTPPHEPAARAVKATQAGKILYLNEENRFSWKSLISDRRVEKVRERERRDKLIHRKIPSPNPESLSLRKSNICLSKLYHYKRAEPEAKLLAWTDIYVSEFRLRRQQTHPISSVWQSGIFNLANLWGFSQILWKLNQLITLSMTFELLGVGLRSRPGGSRLDW